jgi:predicted nuclease of predicted toxin-antitoxin system
VRLLADENRHVEIIRRLRAAGHDALAAAEQLQGQPRDVVLRRAQTDGRILITHDKGFGQRAKGLPPSGASLLIVRIPTGRIDLVWQRLDDVLNRYPANMTGCVGLAAPAHVRFRPF